MKAVQVQRDGSVAVVDTPVPEIQAGEALVRTRVVGICGSDLLSWYVMQKAGTVLGHEVAGEIVDVGSGVTDFSPGDRIAPHHHAPCLVCDACEAAKYVHCRTWRTTRLDPGGMAEFFRVSEANLRGDTLTLPPGLSFEAASLTEPLATVVKAFRRAAFRRDQTVLVVGLGTAGQLAVRFARAHGASRVVGVDRVDSRLLLARESGADSVLDLRITRSGDPRELEERRRYDLVFLCPGQVEAMRSGLELVAPGGTLLLFTMAPPEARWEISPNDVYFREVSIVPSYSCGPDDTREALDLIASRRVSIDGIITQRYPLEEAVTAFERARRPEGSVKVVLTS
jgi:L-iditol 2-dehydrogenase